MVGHGVGVAAGHLSAIVAKASLGAKALAVLGVGVAGVAIAAQTGAAPGIQVALQHVPVWTHAHSILSSLRSSLAAHGSGGFHLGLGP